MSGTQRTIWPGRGRQPRPRCSRVRDSGCQQHHDIQPPGWAWSTAPANQKALAKLIGELANRRAVLKEELKQASERKAAANKTQAKLRCAANRAKHISSIFYSRRGSRQSLLKCLYELGLWVTRHNPQNTLAAPHLRSRHQRCTIAAMFQPPLACSV